MFLSAFAVRSKISFGGTDAFGCEAAGEPGHQAEAECLSAVVSIGGSCDGNDLVIFDATDPQFSHDLSSSTDVTLPAAARESAVTVLDRSHIHHVVASDGNYLRLADITILDRHCSTICGEGLCPREGLSPISPIPGGWLGAVLSEEAVMCGYQLALPWEAGVEATDYHPRSWTLEGSVDGVTWQQLDRREAVQLSAPHNDRTVGVAETRAPDTLITVMLSTPVVIKRFRLHIHTIGASTGSMSGATRDGKGVRLSSIRLLTPAAGTSASSPFVRCDMAASVGGTFHLQVGWRLVLSGPPGQQRFRLLSSDRRLDAVAVAPVVLTGASYAVRACITVSRCREGGAVLAAALSVDGTPCILTPHADFLHQKGTFFSLPSGSSGIGCLRGASSAAGFRGSRVDGLPAEHEARALRGSTTVKLAELDEAGASNARCTVQTHYPCSVVLRPLRRITIGGPAFAAAHTCPASGAGQRSASLTRVVIGEPALGYDCPGYPSSSLRCFRGAIADLDVSLLTASTAAAASKAPTADAAAAEASTRALKLVHEPSAGGDESIGQPLRLGDAARATPLVPTAETVTQPRVVAAPLQTLEHVLLWRPQPAADALLRCTVPLKRATDSDDSDHRPRVLLCHDCGTTVYKEDASVLGYHVPAAEPDDAAGIGAGHVAEAGSGVVCSVEEVVAGAVKPSGASAPFHAAEGDAEALGLPPCKTSALPSDPAGECLDAALAADAAVCTLLAQLLLPAHIHLAPLPLAGEQRLQLESLQVGHAYTFTRWHAIDAFVYFSHARVSIPPPGWIAAAHCSGVPVLGTIITEWADGVRANDMLCAPYSPADASTGTSSRSAGGSGGAAAASLSTRGGPSFMAMQLADIAAFYGFDGWLINIESQCSGRVSSAAESTPLLTPEAGHRVAAGGAGDGPISDLRHTAAATGSAAGARRGAGCEPLIHPGAAAMAAFVADLRQTVRERVGPSGQVIWYDSIIASSGRVRWQSALTDENASFFAAADGMFTDYHWNPDMVRETARRAALAQSAGTAIPSTGASALSPLAVSSAGIHSSSTSSGAAVDSSLMSATAPSTPCKHSDGRRSDVWVGVDMWGRGTYGGGGWSCRTAIDAIINQSAATASPHASDAVVVDAAASASPAITSEGLSSAATAAPTSDAVDSTPGPHSLRPLSVALFAPAWTYEAQGGAADAGLFASLEAKLWDGIGAAQPEDGFDAESPAATSSEAAAAAALPPPAFFIPKVVNPSGNATAAATETERLSGWSVTADGGNGWTVEQLIDGAAPAAGITSCFVTSYGWCWAEQTVPLRRSLREPLPASVTVSEWYAGTGPNYADQYRFCAELVDARGVIAHLADCPAVDHVPVTASAASAEPAASTASAAPAAITEANSGASVSSPRRCTCGATFDSGELTTQAGWRQVLHTFTALPSFAVAVRIRHGGKDAEHWAGHFGARMCGASVTVPRPPAVAAARRLAGVAAASTLPARLPPLSDDPAEAGAGTVMSAAGPSPASTIMCVRLSPAAVDELRLLPSYRPLLTADTLPFSSSFNTGRGAHLFQNGATVRRGAWVNIGAMQPQPCFTGLWATHGLENVHGTLSFTVTHHAGISSSASGGTPEALSAGNSGASSTVLRFLEARLTSVAASAAMTNVNAQRVHMFTTHRCAWDGGASVVIAGRVNIPPSIGTHPSIQSASTVVSVAEPPSRARDSSAAILAPFALARLWTASIRLTFPRQAKATTPDTTAIVSATPSKFASAASATPPHSVCVRLTFRAAGGSGSTQWQVLPVPVWQLESPHGQLALLWPSQLMLTGASSSSAIGHRWSVAEARFSPPTGLNCRAVCLLIALCVLPSAGLMCDPESTAAGSAAARTVASSAGAAASGASSAEPVSASIPAALIIGQVDVW